MNIISNTLKNFFTRKSIYCKTNVYFQKVSKLYYLESINLRRDYFRKPRWQNSAETGLRDRERERALYKVKRVSYACLMARWNGTFEVIQSSCLRLEFRVRFPYIPFSRLFTRVLFNVSSSVLQYPHDCENGSWDWEQNFLTTFDVRRAFHRQ